MSTEAVDWLKEAPKEVELSLNLIGQQVLFSNRAKSVKTRTMITVFFNTY